MRDFKLSLNGSLSKKVNTIRKRVADKVRPLATPLPEEARLFVDLHAERLPKIYNRLNKETISQIRFGEELLPAERETFIQMLHHVQRALGFEPEHLGRLRASISSNRMT